MANLTVKDFLLFYLKTKYNERVQIINNLMYHIENLHLNFLINNVDRNKFMKDLNNTIKVLNITYNSKSRYIKGINCIENDNESSEIYDNDIESSDPNDFKDKLDCLLSSLIDISYIKDAKKSEAIFESIMKLENICEIKVISNLCNTYFNYNDIDKKIKELMNNIGSNNLNDIFKIYIKKSYENIFINNNDDKQIIMLLCDKFNSINVLCNEKKEKSSNKQKISICKQDTNMHEILLSNFYKIILNISTTTITVCGFFNVDCLNINLRTSQLCNKFVDNKRKILLNNMICDNIKNKKVKQKMNQISELFKNAYIKNITIGELLSFNKTIFYDKLLADYELYKKYSTSNNFRSLFNDFIKSNLLTKYKIIRYLLMGPTSAVNNAGLLFSLTKENKNGSSTVADIFYKNLNLQAQIKLHKANFYIKNEIDKFNNLDEDDIDLKKQIVLNMNIPARVKKLAMEKLEEMKSGNSEYYKQLQFVKIIAEYPWLSKDDDDIFTSSGDNLEKWCSIMKNTHACLDKQVYGHKECKETIVELLGKWFSNPNSLGKAVGLQGPPGVGKTLIAKGFGEALGIPFTQINLGGMEDGSVLTGHSITYSGAVPGLIVKKMVEAGKPRCIIFFDELDKACFRHGRNEIYDILIHAIDPNSNTEFNDKFFQDVRFPINKVLFVFSFNDKSKISPILLDRMEIIDVKAYSVEDKILISKNFLMKEILQDIGIKSPTIEIKDSEINYIIEEFTYEAGVRDLKRKLEKIILKLNKDRIFQSGIFSKNKKINKVSITKNIIDTYLKKPNIIVKKIYEHSEVGSVNGLFATTSGLGGIIPILVYRHQMGSNNKFILKLTGKQGTVMKESVSFAWTIASNLVKLAYCKKFFDVYPSGLHIHTPDGATPKDGPSAGGAFTLAFISIILNKPIKNTIAMTGEIERNGHITAIGGLEYKLDGAKRAGVKLVFVPKENLSDIKKIKESCKTLFDDKFKYIAVDHIREVVEMALIDNSDKIMDKNYTYKNLFNCNEYLENIASVQSSQSTLDNNIVVIDEEENSDSETSDNESDESDESNEKSNDENSNNE